MAQLLNLVSNLYKLQHDSGDERNRSARGAARAKLAALRASAGRSSEAEFRAMPVLAEFLDDWDSNSNEAARLVARLFADDGRVPENENDQIYQNPSFGTTARAIALNTNSDATERRFLAMLDADEEQMSNHVQWFARMAASHPKDADTTIYWKRLALDLNDLMGKDQERRHKVKRAWAREYWRPAREEKQTNGKDED